MNLTHEYLDKSAKLMFQDKIKIRPMSLNSDRSFAWYASTVYLVGIEHDSRFYPTEKTISAITGLSISDLNMALYSAVIGGRVVKDAFVFFDEKNAIKFKEVLLQVIHTKHKNLGKNREQRRHDKEQKKTYDEKNFYDRAKASQEAKKAMLDRLKKRCTNEPSESVS